MAVTHYLKHILSGPLNQWEIPGGAGESALGKLVDGLQGAAVGFRRVFFLAAALHILRKILPPLHLIEQERALAAHVGIRGELEIEWRRF